MSRLTDLLKQTQKVGITQGELAGRLASLLAQPLDASAVARIESGSRSVKIDEAVATRSASACD